MIISASRRTDLPVFYSDWYFNRLKAGFVDVRNPIAPRRVRRVSLLPEDAELFVFWTKNPAPMLNRLEEIESPFYFQFTLTPYGRELEPGLPDKKTLVETFRVLGKRIGRERLVWRYDPIVLGGAYNLQYHEKAFRALCREIGDYACRCIISFLDIYRCNQKAMEGYSDKPEEYRILAERLAGITKQHGLPLYTCSEEMDLSEHGIFHAACIDPVLAEKLIGRQRKRPKDKSQRSACGCVQSVDIGAYHSCLHGCKYCYANGTADRVRRNSALHSPSSTMLLGSLTEKDVLYESKEREKR